MLVLVTGASGFVGGHLCERLLASGHAVRALVRATSDTSLLGRIGVEIATGDVTDAGSLDPAVDGVDAIAHVAGVVKALDRETFHRVNVGGTENLLRAVRKGGRGLRRFVQVSSMAVTGPADGPHPPPADRPPRPVSVYGRTKAAGEALALAEADSMPVTAVRPCTVYGPRDRSFLPLFRTVARGVRPVLVGPSAVSTIHVRDCVAAIEAILDRDHPSGRVYPVDDGEAHTQDEIGRAAEAAVGRRALRIPLPRLAVWPMAAVTSFLGRIRGRAEIVTLDRVTEFTQPYWVVGHEAITRDLGWEPTVPLGEGFRETAAWYRENGWM